MKRNKQLLLYEAPKPNSAQEITNILTIKLIVSTWAKFVSQKGSRTQSFLAWDWNVYMKVDSKLSKWTRRLITSDAEQQWSQTAPRASQILIVQHMYYFYEKELVLVLLSERYNMFIRYISFDCGIQKQALSVWGLLYTRIFASNNRMSLGSIVSSATTPTFDTVGRKTRPHEQQGPIKPDTRRINRRQDDLIKNDETRK